VKNLKRRGGEILQVVAATAERGESAGHGRERRSPRPGAWRQNVAPARPGRPDAECQAHDSSETFAQRIHGCSPASAPHGVGPPWAADRGIRKCRRSPTQNCRGPFSSLLLRRWLRRLVVALRLQLRQQLLEVVAVAEGGEVAVLLHVGGVVEALGNGLLQN